MDSICAVLELIQRKLELGELIRQPGGLRTSEESELLAIQARLDACTEEVAEVFQVAQELRRPLRALTGADLRGAMVARA